MSYVVLARKWRPMSFADLVGQDHVARTLANAIAQGRVAHAFLFTGVRGVGKTTSARILAKALNCMSGAGPTHEPCLRCAACKEITEGRDVDVQEIDGASYNGVDEVRKLQESLPYRPARDRFKIIIVDEVHMLSSSAWNAFLKTLEEPPPHVKFIFATTEVHKVPVTILSRVQRFDFKLISTKQIIERIRHVLNVEQIRADDAALAIIAREAAGSMRDAMSLLEQVIAWSSDQLDGDQVSQVLGVASRKSIFDLCAAVIGADAAAAVRIISNLSNEGFEMKQVLRDTLAVLRDIVLCATCPEPDEVLDLPDEERRQVAELARHSTDDLLRLHQALARGSDDVIRSGQPRAALEMLLIRLCRRPPLVPIGDLIERLIKLEKRIYSAGGGRLGGAGGRPRQPPPGAAEFRPETRPPSSSSESSSLNQPGPPATRLQAPTRGPTPSPPPSARPPEAKPPTSPTSAPPREPASPGRPAEPIHRGGTPPTLAPRATSHPATPLSAAEPTSDAATRPALAGAIHVSQSAAAGVDKPSPDVPIHSEQLASESSDDAEVVHPDSDPVMKAWRPILATISEQHPQLGAFLSHTQPVKVSKEVLELKYQKASVVEPAITGPEALAIIGNAAREHLGQLPAVKLIGVEGEQLDTASAADKRARAVAQLQAREEASRHPAVLEAINVLGAKLKHIALPE